MKKAPKIYESHLYDIWIQKKFIYDLETISGEMIEIMDAGTQNIDTGGPDFKNARIKIGNLTYVGDIEIDGDYTDWKSHGHNIDAKYNKVVLHASLYNKFDQPYVYTKDGRKVPTVCLEDFVEQEKLVEVSKKNQPIKNKSGYTLKCDSMNDDLPAKTKEKFIYSLGMDRFKKKCDRIYKRLKELEYIKELNLKEPVVNYNLGPDFHERDFNHDDFKDKTIWQQLFYELIFEALGYSKNKAPMTKLSQKANVNFLNKLEIKENVIDKFEAIFFNVGGLVSNNHKNGENTSTYLKTINNYWENLKNKYDNDLMDETQWHFFKLRPQNFPTIRIAGGSRILKSILYDDLIHVIIKKIDEIRNLKVLINSVRSLFVIKSDGYWREHYVFEKKARDEIKYFIGASRADEIVINVILPFFAVYFEIFGSKNLAKKVFKIFSIYQQKSENKIINEVAESLSLKDLKKRTVFAQGMIELFRSYCSKGKCLECEVGKEVFN